MPQEDDLDFSKFCHIICPALNQCPPHSDSSAYYSSLEYFKSIPWCAAVLNDPKVIAFIPPAANPASPRHDAFFGHTLRHEGALKHVLAFFRVDDPSVITDATKPVEKVSAFWAIGEGLGGYFEMLHGGMTMALMDEGTSLQGLINVILQKERSSELAFGVTAKMETKFIKKIPVGGVVQTTAWTERREGKKAICRCDITDENGQLLAIGISTWVLLNWKI